MLSIMYQTSNSKGQEVLAQKMVKWARRHGIEAWLLTSEYHDGEKIVELGDKPFKLFENDPAVEVPSIRARGSRVSWPPRRIMINNLVEILEEVDKALGGANFLVTHSTVWNGPEDVSRWVMWRKMVSAMGGEARRIVYAHMSHYQPPDPTRYPLEERAYRAAWNRTELPSVFAAADLILCVTGIEAEDMISMGARPDTIHIFPGGLDDDEAKLIDGADPTLFLDMYRIPRDAKIVAYLGTVEERKNPLAVVKVAKSLRHRRDVVFVIAGRPGDQWDDVVREARSLDNVVITGELSREAKASLIRASYLNIIMSRLEAIGLTQIEFMYGGVPVITSATYGQKWLIRNGIDGIHVSGPDDVEGAAKAVEQLLDNEEARNTMGRNARERASQFLMSRLMTELLDRAKHIAHS